MHQTDNLNGKSIKTMETSFKKEHNENICPPTIVLNSLHSVLQSAFIFLDSISIKVNGNDSYKQKLKNLIKYLSNWFISDVIYKYIEFEHSIIAFECHETTK